MRIEHLLSHKPGRLVTIGAGKIAAGYLSQLFIGEFVFVFVIHDYTSLHVQKLMCTFPVRCFPMGL